MLSSIGAQSMSTDKDKERIDAARARNIARTNRFLDARQRTIGLDLDVLDQQMRDRRAREAKEKMAAANEFRRNENLYRQVALQEVEDKRLRDEEFAQLRKEWMAQMELNARQRVEEKKFVLSGVDRDVCGTSSAQILAGEDLDYPARKLLQQQQIRAWTEQHSAENRARKNAECAEMAAYWAYLTKMNGIQAELSEEEKAFRKALNTSIEEENMRLATLKEEDNAKWKENDERANAEEFRCRDILLCEDDDVIANRQHTAPQEYKGFTLKQKAEVVQSNVDMRAERLRMKKKQRQEDEEWYLHQEKLRGIMEEQAHDEYRLRKEAEAQLMKDLREQQLQAQERGMEDRESSFGKIAHTHGMYAGFGKSCR